MTRDRFRDRWRARVRRTAASIAGLPLALRLALLFGAVLHGVGLSWGMPASDGWDVDGVAPRDVLPGLAQTYTPGQFYTYPPLHLAILSALTAPVTLAAAAKASSTALSAVIKEILLPPYMTTIAMVARVVSLVMSVGIALSLAKIAEEVAPPARRRGVSVAVALIVAVGAPFTYYSHVTNLDVPHLFWAWLAALSMVRALARGEPRRVRTAAVLAACAVATKDQAYAMFLVALPVLLLAWIASSRELGKQIAKDAAIGGALAIALLLLIDGAVTNPSGFRARLAFLRGSASQDFATYSNDATGRWLVAIDTVKIWSRHYPPVLGALALAGLVDLVRALRRSRAQLLAGLVPLALALSFTLAFNMAARRVEERFTLPQVLAGAFYAGFALERVWSALGATAPSARWLGRAVAIALLGHGAWLAVRVDATMLQEPRYDAERWLREHARAGDTIETHGLNVYLARFPSGPGAPKVVRVDPSPTDERNPMPGIEEVRAELSAIGERRPRFVVVSECYVWRFMERDLGGTEGRIVPITQRRSASDADATTFFQGLFRGRLGYHLASESRIRSETFPPYLLHASLGCPMFVFERD